MSCIHLITSRQLSEDFSVLSEEDEIVLLAEGTYLISTAELTLKEAASYYVLEDDLKMRGLPNQVDNFKTISQQELVSLVLKHEKSVTW